MSFRSNFFILTAFTLTLFCVLPTSAQTSGAVQKIERFNSTLMTIMQDAQALKFTGRYKTLKPVLLDSFDMGFMAQFSAGKYWHSLSAEDRRHLVSAFSKLWIATYADRFNDYSGERFEIIGSGKAPRNTLMVKTHIIKKNDKKVAINYLMREQAGVWSVIDIFLKGRFSELAKKRAEYTSILKRQGITGLVSIVEDKVRHMQMRGN